jgi:hypothetical protein
VSEREKISARIRALLAKTVENGCTEDEAITAAEKAAEMLARYNLTVDEVEMRASPFSRHTEQHDDPVGERLWKVADGISHLTGARYWSSRPGVWPVEITFFGFDHEVQVAGYLLEICARAMRQSAAGVERQYGLLVPARRRRHVLPFLDGMADRLRQRIRALKPAGPTGTGLIVLHDTLVEQAMKDAGLETEDRSGRQSRFMEEGYLAGRRAADAVALHSGLASGGPVQALLG